MFAAWTVMSCSNGISLSLNGSRSAKKGSVSLSLTLQHRKQRHQSLVEWQQKCKERQCAALTHLGVGGVADDRMAERDAVQPELVPPAGGWPENAHRSHC